MGRNEGLTEAKIAALQDFENSDALDDTEKLCVRYAVGMTKTPQEVPDALFAELRKLFSDEQLVELTVSIAWENYRARFNHAFEIGSAGFSEGAFCPMPDRPSI